MQKSERRILEIARNIRSTAEKVRERCSGRGWVISPGLGGLCGLVSFWLFRELRKNKFRPLFCSGMGHAFLLIRGKVLDVTATQFGTRERVVFASMDALKMKWPKIWGYPHFQFPWAPFQSTVSEDKALQLVQLITVYGKSTARHVYHDEPGFILRSS